MNNIFDISNNLLFACIGICTMYAVIWLYLVFLKYKNKFQKLSEEIKRCEGEGIYGCKSEEILKKEKNYNDAIEQEKIDYNEFLYKFTKGVIYLIIWYVSFVVYKHICVNKQEISILINIISLLLSFFEGVNNLLESIGNVLVFNLCTSIYKY